MVEVKPEESADKNLKIIYILGLVFSLLLVYFGIDTIYHMVTTFYEHGGSDWQSWHPNAWVFIGDIEFPLIPALALSLVCLTIGLLIASNLSIRWFRHPKTKPIRPPKKKIEGKPIEPREELWRVRGRRSRTTGAAFLIISGAFSILLVYFGIDTIYHMVTTFYEHGGSEWQSWHPNTWVFISDIEFPLISALALSLVCLVIGPFIAAISFFRWPRRRIIKPMMTIKKEPIRLPKKKIRPSKRKIEEKPIELRKELWRVRGRRSRVTGAAFLIVSGVFLFLAYSTRYIVFEVTSILALFLGVVLVFTGVEPYVKMRVASKAVVSPLIPLSKLLSRQKVGGKAIHIPAASEHGSGKIFIPAHSGNPLPPLEEIVKETNVMVLDKGVLLPSVGSALLELYEEELENLRNMDLDYLMEWLPRILVEGLQIAEGMEIVRIEEKIHAKLRTSAFRHVCQNVKAVKMICETTGCPLCSSIAEAIAKNTSRIVFYLGCNYDPVTRETSALYRLGPALETLKQKEREEKQNKDRHP